MKTSLRSIVLIAVFLFLSAASAMNESLTFDEVVHVEEGLNAWRHQTFAVDVVNPPLIREIAVIPLLFGVKGFFAPRMMIALLGVVLAVMVYRVVRKRFGKTVAMVSLLFFVFEPNFLAHAHYVTLDAGFTAFFFAAYVSFLPLIDKPFLLRWLLFGFMAGLAFASKVSALMFLPISCFLVLIVMKKRKTLAFVCKQKYRLLGALFVAVITVWATYFFRFDTIIEKRNDPGRVSAKLHEVAKRTNNWILETALTFGETQNVPLGNYVAVVKNSVVFAKQNTPVFYFGTYHNSPRWYFLLFTVLYKTPLPLLLLFFLSTVFLFQKHHRDKRVIPFILPIPVVLFISSVSGVRPMIRYLLPMYPFLVIVAARSVVVCVTRLSKLLFVLACLWLVCGTVFEYPHFVAYANELAGTASTRFTMFNDSNLDWGQSLPDLARYVAAVTPSTMRFSYFGRDNAAVYGFVSDRQYGSHKTEDICAFHDVSFIQYSGPPLTVISVTNWYDCGYYTLKEFQVSRIRDVVAGTFLIF